MGSIAPPTLPAPTPLLEVVGLSGDLSEAVGAGRVGGAIDRKDFDRPVNPISGRGADYALRNNSCPPGFSELPQSLTTTDELKSAALSNEVSNTNSLSPSTNAVFKLSLFIYFYRLFLGLF